jgi:hypothetical protein
MNINVTNIDMNMNMNTDMDVDVDMEICRRAMDLDDYRTNDVGRSYAIVRNHMFIEIVNRRLQFRRIFIKFRVVAFRKFERFAYTVYDTTRSRGLNRPKESWRNSK